MRAASPFSAALSILALLLLASQPIWSAPAPEVGRPLVRVYSAAETGATDETRCAVQDARGIMLFGTRGALLEFDGEMWRRLPVPTRGAVHQLAATSDGTVWLLADGEVGRFTLTPTGSRVYASLASHLPSSTPGQLNDTNSLAAAGDHVWLALHGALARWNGTGFALYPMADPYPAAFHSAGPASLIARSGRGETLLLAAGAPEPVTNAPELVSPPSWLSPRRAPEQWLLAEAGGPLGVVRTENATNRFVPLSAGLESILAGAALPDGGYAFLRAQASVALLDAELRLRAEAGAADGILIEWPSAVCADRGGGVWVCTPRGIARIENRGAVTILDEAAGLVRAASTSLPAARAITLRPASVGSTAVMGSAPMTTVRRDLLTRVIRHEGRLLVQRATGGVLAYDYHRRQFVAAPELAAAVDIAATPSGLLVQEHGSLRWRVPGATPTEWRDTPLTGEPVNTGAGGFVFALKDRFIRAELMPEGARVTEIPFGIEHEALNAFAESPEVWWLEAGEQLLRVRLDGNRIGARDDFSAKMPPRNLIKLARVGGEWLALTQGGLRRFDPARQRFEPWTRFGADLADGSCVTRDIATEAASRVWLIVQRSPSERDSDQLISREPDGRRRELPRDVRLRLGRLMSLSLDSHAPGGPVLWLIGFNALGRIDLARWTVTAEPMRFPVNLRAALIVGGEALPLINPPPELTQAARTLRVSYAAAHFPLSGQVEYQTWLEGLEPAWSDWQPASTREFTNLPVGRYTLHVRARRDEAEGRATPYAFSIVPPWWRSIPALAAWTLFAGGGAVGFMRWRGRTLRRRNEALERVVDARTAELRANEGQLRIARDAAEAANRAKSTFLAHMSHELRTPLNGILGYAQVLRRDPTQPAPARERLGVIVDSGEHLLVLINEVLDLAKVEAGKMELRPVDVSLDRLARGVADLVQVRCEEKGLAFAVEIAAGLPRLVRTDEQKLRQALLNLIGNAIKFTARGRVTLSIATTADGRVRFTVEDTGSGIAPERVPTLFTAFDSTATQAAQGTGLGLALSQRMIELLGGRIQVSSTQGAGPSTALRTGSRFWFDLPLPEVGSTEPFGPGERARIVTGYKGPRRRVLVVDDEPVNRAVLRELLAPLGFIVEEAADATSALALCGTGVAQASSPARSAEAGGTPALPDVVLLDLRFDKGIDGFEIARKLRTEPHLSATKIIAVSASVFESDRHEALAAGCDAFLAKPFNEEQLFATLGGALDLEWIHAESAPIAAAVSAVAPPAEVRVELLELARRGDARRLRSRLAELAADPAQAAFARQLDELAAGFQMKRIREILSQPLMSTDGH